MGKTDFINLDGKVLRVVLTILEASSIPKSADRLDATQSAITILWASCGRFWAVHCLSGQDLTPTKRALSLKVSMQSVSDNMCTLTVSRPFNPLSKQKDIQIATNDMPRELIFPDLLRAMQDESVRLRLKIIPSDFPDSLLLRFI